MSTDKANIKREKVHTWHIEMLDRTHKTDEDLRKGYDLKLVESPLPELNRFLYVIVGAPWTWYMKLPWSYKEWQDYLGANIQTWIAYKGGTPIGYFELDLQPEESVEIAYFGLIPEAIGRGFGKALLQDAIVKAWDFGGKRVWLHTCSLDHPQALNNYLARGFKVFKEEELIEEIPIAAIQPWEGANKSY
ncbi:MAG: GNAT family N-acetyltransferase [Gammaproteobacteria bacterium]|jgi:GNAT superfamily N-acetyltransferase|nr:GNAT family N-acetyltransferase [Gammaproteobacteria bacterium]|tara:strand:- start:195 stop:764 length:570 start_codon:yes stop_codon:yes gene_type:complete